ncbi:hypothetical protein SFRURICE_017174, partial [Spodoptera frugiperda]
MLSCCKKHTYIHIVTPLIPEGVGRGAHYGTTNKNKVITIDNASVDIKPSGHDLKTTPVRFRDDSKAFAISYLTDNFLGSPDFNIKRMKKHRITPDLNFISFMIVTPLISEEVGTLWPVMSLYNVQPHFT